MAHTTPGRPGQTPGADRPGRDGTAARPARTPTPRPDLIPTRPALIVAEQENGVAARLRELCASIGWSHLLVTEEAQLRWSATVHRPAAVIVVAGTDAWVDRTAKLARATGFGGAVAIVGALPSPRVIAVLRSGVDVVAAPDLPGTELLARILAVVRRSSEAFESGARYLVGGPVRVDLWQREVRLDDEVVSLSVTEYKLLVHLMRNSGRTVDSRTILGKVWGWMDGGGLNTLRIHIGRLRRKLGDDAKRPTLVLSARGYGYSFGPQVLEMGDEGRGSRLVPAPQVDMLRALTRLIERFGRQPEEEGCTRELVETLVADGTADAVAVHHVHQDRLRLIAHKGLSQAWVRAVAPEVPLRSGFACAHAVQTESPVQLMRLSAGRFRDTFQACSQEVPGAYLFLPIKIGTDGSACMGVVRHRDEPYGPTTLSYLNAVATAYGSHLAARRAGRRADVA